jgi:hypothetical protein
MSRMIRRLLGLVSGAWGESNRAWPAATQEREGENRPRKGLVAGRCGEAT